MNNPTLLTTLSLPNYELIDSGEGEKLERFGKIILRRPDPQALWKKKLDDEWDNAAVRYISGKGKGRWQINKDHAIKVPDSWDISLDELNFELRLSLAGESFKHVGIFPEQYDNWKWIKETIKNNKTKFKSPSILNLFAYTGGATIAALQAGAKVTHVDSSPGAIEWAQKNAELSGVNGKAIRWMLDDARKFVEKEIRRGVFYHGIIMDPPSYGHGLKRQIWDIEKDFRPLMESVRKVLHNEPMFVLLNGYSSGYSSVAYAENISFLNRKFGGTTEFGELSIQDRSKRHLPAGIFARWRR